MHRKVLSELDVTALQTPLKEHIAQVEKEMIDLAMHEAQFNQAMAAKLLGLSYHQLRAYLKKYSLVTKYSKRKSPK